MLLIVSLIISVAAVFMIIGTAWSGKVRFEKATQKQFDLSISLTKLTIGQLLSDINTGLNSINNNAELARDTITGLGAPKPRRKNFYSLFYKLFEFSKEYNLSQSTIHFKSMGRDDYQIYSLTDVPEEKVLSYSTKIGENGKKQIQLTRDQFGFINRNKEVDKTTKYKFPESIRADDSQAAFHSTEKGLFFDIQYNLVNNVIGKKKEENTSEEEGGEKEGGFAFIGMKYGVIRTFSELKPVFLESLEQQAGVHLDIFSNDGTHLLGQLSSNPVMEELTTGTQFSLISKEEKYISQGSPIEIAGKRIGFLVTSVPRSELTAEIIDIVLQLVAIISITCSLGVFFISLFLTKTVTNPLLVLRDSVKKLAGGDLAHQATIQTHDEIGTLGISVNKMASDLLVAFDTIEDQNRNLEQRVQERTREVNEKSQNIRIMLSNLQQGVFILLPGNLIDKEYSDHLCEIMETTEVAEKGIEEFLLNRSNLTTDSKDSVLATLFSCLNETSLSFELNSDNLVKELEVNINGSIKSLEIDWNPIIDEDIVTKMMVTIRDVTELKKLQLQAMNRRRDLEIIGQIIAITPVKFGQFMAAAHKMIEASREQLSKSDSPDSLNELFRNMHTIKGNSRVFNFSVISDKAHEAEVVLEKLRKDPPKSLPQEQLLADLNALDDILLRYEKINSEDLGRKVNKDTNDENFVMVQLDVVSEALRLLKNINSSSVESLRNNTNLVRQHLLRIGTQPLSDMISGVIDSVPSLAKDLGKPVPDIRIDEEYILPKMAISELINDVCMHVFRNSLDHGIETEAERKKQGKKPKGAIKLKLKSSNDNICMIFSDDGAGLNLNRLKEKAREKGLLHEGRDLSNEEAANLVFLPSVSTAEKVTNISGRGVGMDAVASFVKNHEGHIKLNLIGKASKGRIKFEIEVQLPKKYFTEIEQPNSGTKLVP